VSRARRLALGDLAALALFVALGLVSHDDEPVTAFLRSFFPLATAYALVAAATGAWTTGWLSRLALTWIVAVPLGVAARALILGRDEVGDQVSFGLVALAMSGLLLVVWRLLERRVWRPSASAAT
jgi:hypothetical protein